MSAGMRVVGRVLVPAIVAMAVLAVFSGCGRQPIVEQQSDANDRASADQPTVVAAAAIEQTTCPVMEGNPINKSLFVEYKGKKVYFCCPGCPETFLANPEKYIAKLPQFKEQ